MNKNIILFIFMSFSINLMAQDSTIDKTKAPEDKNINVKEIDEILSKENPNFVNLLAKLSTGNSFSSYGNFAALSTTSEAIKGSIFFVDESAGMYTLNVEAGAAQGVAALFDEGKLNSKVSLGGEYRMLVGESTAISDESLSDELDKEENAIENTYRTKMLALANRIKEISPALNKYELVTKKIKSITEYLAPYNAMNPAEFNAISSNQKAFIEEVKKVKAKLEEDTETNIDVLKDSLKALYHKEESQSVKENNKKILEQLAIQTKTGKSRNLYPKVDKQIKAMKDFVAQYEIMRRTLSKAEYDAKIRKNEESFQKEIEKLKNELENSKITDIEKFILTETNLYVEEKNKKLEAVKKKRNAIIPDLLRMDYLAFGLKATNNNFVRFIDTLALKNQLKPQDYTTLSFQINYNIISNISKEKGKSTSSLKPLTFLSFGAVASYTDNLGSLKQVEVTDTKIVGEDTGREQISRQNAFVGDYEKDLGALLAYIDYYKFIKPTNNSIALHVNPRMMFKENLKPNTSIQFGLLFPFKKKDSETTIVNLEVFYQLKDVFNTGENENSLLNRNIIGLQTSFPFNF